MDIWFAIINLLYSLSVKTPLTNGEVVLFGVKKATCKTLDVIVNQVATKHHSIMMNWLRHNMH